MLVLPRSRTVVFSLFACSLGFVSMQSFAASDHATHDSHTSEHATHPTETHSQTHAEKTNTTTPTATPGVTTVTKGRLEDNEAAIEAIRELLQNGIPERATLKIKVKSDEPSNAANHETTRQADHHSGHEQTLNKAVGGGHTANSSTHTAALKPSGAPANPVDSRKAKSNNNHSAGNEHIHWSYEGDGAPHHWESLSTENALCGKGVNQSPIHITPDEAIHLDLEPLALSYGGLAGQITNNGHTVKVDIEGANTLTIRGKTYSLLQFHFHHPAEHRINDKQPPMVAHFVHRSEQGDLAVLGVLIEEGEENQTINHLWSRLPFLANQTNPLDEGKYELKSLLPTDNRYFVYSGSLTTPPCTENVLWVILQMPITLSKSQIKTFSRLYPNNTRPVQPVNHRLIQASQ